MKKFDRRRFIEKINTADESGNGHTVVIFERLLEIIENPKWPSQWAKRRKSIFVELEDKRPVNQIDGNTFQIATTGQILKRLH